MARHCAAEHMLEFRHDEDCDHSKVHEVPRRPELVEVETLPKDHARHEWSAAPRLVVADELRQAKVLRTRGDWDSGQDVAPRPMEALRLVVVHGGEMPSVHGRDVRSCSRKLEAASLYARQWHRGVAGRPKGSGGKGAVADEAKLAEHLKALGL